MLDRWPVVTLLLLGELSLLVIAFAVTAACWAVSRLTGRRRRRARRQRNGRIGVP